jgi:putative membrane protein
VSRETENTLLLLVGLSIGLITFTGAFTRYVKPSLLPWLAVTAVLLVGLALASIAGDIKRGGPAHVPDAPTDGHSHHGGVVWLLVVPVVLLVFVTPPALRPQAAARAVTTTGTARRAFPPLPPERAPEVSLPDALMRSANDTGGSLDNRLVTITGFVLNETDGVDLARIVIVCCAADAQLARIHLRDLKDVAAAQSIRFPDNTWLRVEGVVIPAERQPHTAPIPTLRAVTITRIDPPANPYG